DARLEDARDPAQDVLHAPEAAARDRCDGTVGRRFRLVLVVLEERQVAAVPLGLELLDRDEAEGRRVDAVAKARRGRPVVEDVPEMRFTMLGADLGPFHEELAILAPLDVLVLERASEARPSGSRVELVERAEERLAGGDVDVDARLLAVPEGVVERRLGGLVLGHLVLLLGERLVELRVAGLGIGLHGLVSGRTRLASDDGRRREEREAPDEREDSRASVHVSVGWMTVPCPTFPCARPRVNGRGREVRRGRRSRAPGRRGRYVFRSHVPVTLTYACKRQSIRPSGQARHLEANFVLRGRHGPQACTEGARGRHGRRSRPHPGRTRRRKGAVLRFHETDPWRPQAWEHEGPVRWAGRSSPPTPPSVIGNMISSWPNWKRSGPRSS